MANYEATVFTGEYWIQSAINYWTAISFPAIYFAKYL